MGSKDKFTGSTPQLGCSWKGDYFLKVVSSKDQQAEI
jgi:hypothetical protein